MLAITTPSSLACACLDLANKAGWVGRETLKPTCQTCKEILAFCWDLQTGSLPKHNFAGFPPLLYLFSFFFFSPSLPRTAQALCFLMFPLCHSCHTVVEDPDAKAVTWELDVLSLVPCFVCTVCVGRGLHFLPTLLPPELMPLAALK